jgi:hypothetical protein
VPFDVGPEDEEGVQAALDALILELDPVRANAPDVISSSLEVLAVPVIVSPREIDKLETAARQTVFLTRVQKLVDFVGDGRKLTDKGNLTVADGKALVRQLGTDDEVDVEIGDRVFKTVTSTRLPGVDLIFRVALAGDFVEMPSTRRVRAGSNAALLEDDPLKAVGVLLLALVDCVGPARHHWAGDTYGWGWYAEDLDGNLLPIMMALRVPRAYLEIDAVADEVWVELLDSYDLDDVEPDKLEFHRGLVNYALRRALDRLDELGVVKQREIERRQTEWGTTDEQGGNVSLTPLGEWVVRHVVKSLRI